MLGHGHGLPITSSCLIDNRSGWCGVIGPWVQGTDKDHKSNYLPPLLSTNNIMDMFGRLGWVGMAWLGMGRVCLMHRDR